jgi:DNA polymerase-1
MISVSKNKRLKELGFRLLIPVHDELIAECPVENVKECSKLLSDIMSKTATKILEIPINCDVSITSCWYGEELSF